MTAQSRAAEALTETAADTAAHMTVDTCPPFGCLPSPLAPWLAPLETRASKAKVVPLNVA